MSSGDRIQTLVSDQNLCSQYCDVVSRDAEGPLGARGTPSPGAKAAGACEQVPRQQKLQPTFSMSSQLVMVARAMGYCRLSVSRLL